MSIARRSLLALAPCVAVACASPPIDRGASEGYPNFNVPLGRIEGTIVYQGPAPATDAAGRPIGRVVLLLFANNNPPPPRGLATTAESIQTVPASVLFANATRLPDGSVRATAPYTLGGIARADEYQIRAFYSARDETVATAADGRTRPTGFQPLFSVRNLPVRGDIGGGAVVDPSAASPTFVSIPVGSPVARTDGGTGYAYGESGAVTRGVTVFLGTPLPLDRPVFHYAQPNNPQRFTEQRPEARPNAAGNGLVEYARRTGFLSPDARILELAGTTTVDETTGEMSPSFQLRVGLETDAERAAALLAGVEVGPRAGLRFLETPFDFNGDGMLSWSPASADPRANLDAHPTLVTVSPMVPSHRFPWVFPLVVLSRLHDPDAAEAGLIASGTASAQTLARVVQGLNAPERGGAGVFPVVMFGSVVPGENPLTGLLAHRPPWTDPTARELEDTVRVVVPPVAFEIHGPNPVTDWTAIVPPLPPAQLAVVQPLLPLHYRCERNGVPAGRYGINLVAQTGQSWSTPNELAPSSLGPTPYQSASQGLVVRITAGGTSSPGTQCPTPPTR